MSDSTVVVDDLRKHYGRLHALDGVSFSVRANTIYGLLGRNGAGKTTLLQIMTGQAFATSGSIRVFGQEPHENEGVLSRIAFVKESQKYPDGFTVRHVLKSASLVYPGWDQAFADELLRDFDLPARRQMKKLSRGMLSAVGIILGLASRTSLTCFDEPYLGLDAVARQVFYDRLLADYSEHPRTIILSTHLIDEVSDLIEHVVLIDRGRVLLDESADDLRTRAVTLAGPAGAVEPFTVGRTVLHRERLGGHSRVTVTPAPDAAEARWAADAGVTVEPVSLQDLVVRTTTARTEQLEVA
jgi:ABC-2 type transport system ATP-binding protein